MKYNQWITPISEGHRVTCECGLVHALDFRVNKGRVEYRAQRNRSTVQQTRRRREQLSRGVSP